MTVQSVTEVNGARSTSTVTTRTGTETRHTRTFRIRTDNRHDADLDILFAAGLPQIGNVHPADPIAFVRNQNAQPGGNKSPFIWEVRILYSTAFEVNTDPTDDSPRVSWSTQQFQTPFIKDRSGNAVVNSAGDPFDPPAEKDDSRWAATLSVNLSVVPSNILLFRNAINSTTFAIDGITIAAQRAFMYAMSIGEVQNRNGVSYRALSYTTQLRDSTEAAWIISIADMGFNQIVSGVKKEILQAGGANNPNDGEPFSAPQQLDGSGVAVASPTALTVVFRDFNAYNLLDFNTLPGI